MSKNICSCILCYLGRNAGFEGDLAPLDKLSAAITAYDSSKSPYTFCDSDKWEMIGYITQKAVDGIVHFMDLEEFFWERHKTEDPQQKRYADIEARLAKIEAELEGMRGDGK
jgi:hypothetical protein